MLQLIVSFTFIRFKKKSNFSPFVIIAINYEVFWIALIIQNDEQNRRYIWLIIEYYKWTLKFKKIKNFTKTLINYTNVTQKIEVKF